MPPPVRIFVEKIATKHLSTVEEMVGRDRFADVVRARHAAMAHLRAVVDAAGEHVYSTPAIGRFFGGRDHTTVLTAIERYANLYGVPPRIQLEDFLAANQPGIEEEEIAPVLSTTCIPAIEAQCRAAFVVCEAVLFLPAPPPLMPASGSRLAKTGPVLPPGEATAPPAPSLNVDVHVWGVGEREVFELLDPDGRALCDGGGNLVLVGRSYRGRVYKGVRSVQPARSAAPPPSGTRRSEAA